MIDERWVDSLWTDICSQLQWKGVGSSMETYLGNVYIEIYEVG